MIRPALLGVLSLLAFPSFAGLDERIQVSIEEPVQGERYSGISNLRGWAVSPEGTGNYHHSVYIDGQFAFYISPYGNRADVGNTFPDYPYSDTAGFSMAFNYKDLSPGEHEIRVRAYDNADNWNDAVVTFTTERFVSSFISSDSDVDLSGLDNVFLYDDQSLLLNGAPVEGKRWNFLLKWDKPSQSFKTWGIEAYTENLSGITDYEIAGSGSSDDAGTTDDCANVTGYNQNCSDSSGSGGSGSSSGFGEDSISSTSTGGDTDDTLTRLDCSTNQIIKWDGLAWVCATDPFAGLDCDVGGYLRMGVDGWQCVYCSDEEEHEDEEGDDEDHEDEHHSGNCLGV